MTETEPLTVGELREQLAHADADDTVYISTIAHLRPMTGVRVDRAVSPSGEDEMTDAAVLYPPMTQAVVEQGEAVENDG